MSEKALLEEILGFSGEARDEARKEICVIKKVVSCGAKVANVSTTKLQVDCRRVLIIIIARRGYLYYDIKLKSI